MDSPPARFRDITVKDVLGNERKFSSDDLVKRRSADSDDDTWAYLNQDIVFLNKHPSSEELDRIANLGCANLPSEK